MHSMPLYVHYSMPGFSLGMKVLVQRLVVGQLVCVLGHNYVAESLKVCVCELMSRNVNFHI